MAQMARKAFCGAQCSGSQVITSDLHVGSALYPSRLFFTLRSNPWYNWGVDAPKHQRVGKMGEWVVADPIIEADVIRWTEAVYDKRRKGNKAMRIGERMVVAEVLELTKDGWARLLVRACTVTRDDTAGRHVPVFKPEDQIRRATKTVLRGKPQRLLWSDESVREALLRDKTEECPSPQF
jgi:hypothetical protein